MPIKECASVSANTIKKIRADIAARRVTPQEMVDWAAKSLVPAITSEVPEAKEPIESLVGELANLVSVIEDAVGNAGSWYERIIAMTAGLDQLVDVVEKAGALCSLSGAGKLTVTYTAALAIYERIDKGHDGSKDRISLAIGILNKIPGAKAISDKLERYAVKYAIVYGIELIISRLNR